MHIGDFMVNLPKSTADCTAMENDISRIAKWAEQFKDPKAVLNKVWESITSKYATLINFLDGFNQTISDDTRNYSAIMAGRYLGAMMVVILGPPPKSEGILMDNMDPDTLQISSW